MKLILPEVQLIYCRPHLLADKFHIKFLNNSIFQEHVYQPRFQLQIQVLQSTMGKKIVNKWPLFRSTDLELIS